MKTTSGEWNEAKEWIRKAVVDDIIAPGWVVDVGRKFKEWIRVAAVEFCAEKGYTDEEKSRLLNDVDGLDNEALGIKKVCFELRAERREGGQ